MVKQRRHLEDDTNSNKKFNKDFASGRERTPFQRPFPLKFPSLSAAADNCDAMSTRLLEDVFNIFSRAKILELLAPGDNVCVWALRINKEKFGNHIK